MTLTSRVFSGLFKYLSYSIYCILHKGPNFIFRVVVSMSTCLTDEGDKPDKMVLCFADLPWVQLLFWWLSVNELDKILSKWSFVGFLENTDMYLLLCLWHGSPRFVNGDLSWLFSSGSFPIGLRVQTKTFGMSPLLSIKL